MSFDFIKHTKERKQFSVDFSKRLNTGEALAGTPTVTVRQGERWKGTDATGNFLDGDPEIQGTSVQFWFADGVDQTPGGYAVVVMAPTDAGRKLVAKTPVGGPITLRVV